MMDSLEMIDYDVLRRQVRLLMLLDGAERAGIAPIRVRHLHTYAYLANVLAPVWDSKVFEGRLLKKRGGPFYPPLQRELDRLVGMGLVSISELAHIFDDDGQWQLDGAFSLNWELAKDVLEVIRQYPEGNFIESFLLEVAYAISALTESELDDLPSEDPTYANETVSYSDVLDFAEWQDLNYTANAARHFRAVTEHTTPSDLLHLYVRHLRRRLRGE